MLWLGDCVRVAVGVALVCLLVWWPWPLPAFPSAHGLCLPPVAPVCHPLHVLCVVFAVFISFRYVQESTRSVSCHGLAVFRSSECC